MNSLLPRAVMAVPRPIRRMIGDSHLLHGFLRRTFGASRTTRATPEGVELVLNPLYHAPLLTLSSLDDYETTERNAFGKLCREGDVVYDVGANVGLFAVYAAHLVGPTGQVVAFEPERNNHECLAETIRANQLDNLQLRTVAVGRRNESAVFDHRGGAFSGRLVDHGRYETTQNTSTVEVVSLDELVAQGELRPPTLVKIDVEGNERLVLEGMEQIMQSHGPTIVCEVHSHLGDSSRQVIQFVEQLGYSLYSLESVAAGSPVKIRELNLRDWFVAQKSTRIDPTGNR
jgi:FkbM family methyltransferase